MSWLWIALLALAVAVLVGAEWPRLEDRLGLAGRRRRQRSRRKAKLRVLTSSEEDDFAASVERDLSLLPTIDRDE
ncbi:MAG: hypothetical protein WD689_11375 [Gaiellaceae bacterium]